MCFGPSSSEKQAAAESRAESDVQRRTEVEGRAETKRDDIDEALSEKTLKGARRSGTGRRSLFSSAGGGFLGRFG